MKIVSVTVPPCGYRKIVFPVPKQSNVNTMSVDEMMSQWQNAGGVVAAIAAVFLNWVCTVWLSSTFHIFEPAYHLLNNLGTLNL